MSVKFNRFTIEDLALRKRSGDSRPLPMAQARLRSNDGEHFWIVYLWPDQQAYERGAQIPAAHTQAACITDTHQDQMGNYGVLPKLGSIHFVSGSWDLNTVAHECTHAILHRMRYLEPRPAKVLQEMHPAYDQNDEERIAYDAGDWVSEVVRFLSRKDPESPYPHELFPAIQMSAAYFAESNHD